VLSSLRNSQGGPALRVRVVAFVLVLGLVLVSAPVIVLPVLRALLGWLLGWL
jgi:hypothetical protein